jgi:secreted trypsin-like serine protease
VSVAGCRSRCCSYAWLALSIGAAAGVVAWGSYVTATARALAGRSPHAHTSVIGGAGVSISRFPFQVALYDPAAGSPMAGFFCGGVIVDATHVITAAHCLAGGGHGRGSVSREVAVLAGSTRLDRPDPGSVRDPAASVSVDPYYNPYTNDYDVGVVALARPLWSGPTAPSVGAGGAIAPLAIDTAAAARYDESSATLATVSGWGDTNPAPAGAPSYPGALRANTVPLVSEALCQEEYAAIEQTITPRMLCAGSSKPRADSCYGDSGGPLVVDRGSPARPPVDYVLVGLVDFGNGCAQPGFAGVYTRIADPAIAHYLASDVGHRAKVAVRRPGHKRKRHRARR